MKWMPRHMLAAARGVEFDARRLSRKFCCNECDLLGCLGGSRCATVLSSQFSVCPDHDVPVIFGHWLRGSPIGIGIHVDKI